MGTPSRIREAFAARNNSMKRRWCSLSSIAGRAVSSTAGPARTIASIRDQKVRKRWCRSGIAVTMPIQRRETRRAGGGAAAATRPAKLPAVQQVGSGKGRTAPDRGPRRTGPSDRPRICRSAHDTRRPMAARRDQPPARFVATDPAVMPRVTQGAGNVAAGAEGQEPGGELRRFAAYQRDARRARPIPSVVGGAVKCRD